MKRRLSISELREYCAKQNFNTILYWAENQDWYCAASPCKVRVSFPNMVVCENPDGVCLRSGGNTVSFERLRYADVDTERSVLGTVLTLFCDDGIGKQKHTHAYTLIAR